MPLAIVIGLVSTGVSLARLYITNQELFTELVWAEDGLFPLCVANHGYWSCLWDPYAGYLLFLSRTLAVPVAYAPIDSWPLATNLVAALSYGATSMLIYWLLRRIPINRLAASFSALVPVLLPIVGLEAINTAGSVYMVLLAVATIATCANFKRPLPPWFLPTLLLIAAMTIPVALVLGLPLVIRYLRRELNLQQFLVPSLGLVTGSVIQFTVIINAAGQRQTGISPESITGWIEGVSTAGAGLVGFRLDLLPTGQMSWAGDPISLPLGIALVLVLTLLALAMFRHPKLEAPSLMIVTGLCMSAIPSILGFNNNRYFVTLSAIVVVTVVILLAQGKTRRSRIVTWVLTATLIGLWAPYFAADQFRATPEPRWSYMLDEARARCLAEPQRVDVVLRFTPVWPYEDNTLTTLNQPLIPCAG